MPTRPTTPFRLIESTQDLREAVALLGRPKLLAVDTEFIGEKSYYPTLEIIQLHSGTGDPILVDARTVTDLSPLKPLLADKKVEKIIHSASQDIAILARAVPGFCGPLFDTQLAAAMAGLGEQVSLANLVRDLLGSTIDKAETVSDWSARPLRPAQLEYAASDVLYLHDLRTEIARRLESLGRMDWFREEQDTRFEAAARPVEASDAELYRSVKEWGKVPESKLVILQQLALWREERARKNNVPRRSVMQDQLLIQLTKLAPSGPDQLKGHRHLPVGQVTRYGDEVFRAIASAKEIPRDQWPTRPRGERPDIPTGLVEILQALIRSIAEKESIAPTLLATTTDLQMLVNHRRRVASLDIPVMKGWRRELVGEKLLALLEGKIVLRVHNRNKLVFQDSETPSPTNSR
jgi:ribonuclease D